MVDAAQDKQPYQVWIPDKFTEEGQSKSGHEVWTDFDESSEDILLRANYYLFPNPATGSAGAEHVRLVPLDPDLEERQALEGSGTAGVLHGGDEGQVVYSIKPEDPDGDWRVIFTADDAAGPATRRDHTYNRMIAVNYTGAARSMLSFSSNSENNGSSGWYAVWIDAARVSKTWQSHNLSTPQQRKSVARRITELSGGSYQLDDDKIVPARATLNTPKTYGREWAAINGGFYSSPVSDKWAKSLPASALGGQIAGGQKDDSGTHWKEWFYHAPTMEDGVMKNPDTISDFHRYAIGMKEKYNAAAGASNPDMNIAATTTETVSGFDLQHAPLSFQYNYPYGRSGFLALLQNGIPHVYNYQYNNEENATRGNRMWIDPVSFPSADSGGGIMWRYSNWDTDTLNYYQGCYRYSAIAWTQNSRHIFLLVTLQGGSGPEGRTALEVRDMFAKYATGTPPASKSYLGGTSGQGVVLRSFLEKYKSLQSKDRVTFPENHLPLRIENAVLLDGGHSASVLQRRYVPPGKHGLPPTFQDRGYWLNDTYWDPNGNVITVNASPAITDTVEFTAK